MWCMTTPTHEISFNQMARSFQTLSKPLVMPNSSTLGLGGLVSTKINSWPEWLIRKALVGGVSHCSFIKSQRRLQITPLMSYKTQVTKLEAQMEDQKIWPTFDLGCISAGIIHIDWGNWGWLPQDKSFLVQPKWTVISCGVVSWVHHDVAGRRWGICKAWPCACELRSPKKSKTAGCP